MTYLRLSAIALAVLAAATLTWWVADMRGDLRAARAEIDTLRLELRAEQLERKADVAALTALSDALTTAHAADTADREALSDAIDTKNPQPASAGLAALFQRLRAEDRQRAQRAPASAR